ncbi:MAG: hypothetical protein JW819_09940 [Candidatus Krumholzibacteriota bacterium]|nr:hypothetical protein [Candidatus Krumholzibacteriota bacterium]
MKKLMLALLLLVAMSSLASAENYIGLFADVDGTYCYGDVEVGVPLVVHVMAMLDPDIEGITAAEFRIDNYPGNPGYPIGITTPTWDSPLTVGTLDWGFSIAFSIPQPGPIVHMGTIEFLAFDPTWIAGELVMEVVETNDSGNLVVVDFDYNTIPVSGGQYTFNCLVPENCPCIVGVPTQDSSWGSVKALY